jgi:hypothetical protein
MATTDDYPHWGRYQAGVPGGGEIRAENHGADATNTPKEIPSEDVAQGWRNKARGSESDAMGSDPSQYEMQTSMTQRHKVRAGSQISGTASTFDAPIESRTAGQKIKWWSGEKRHEDMLPKSQDQLVRPWWNRTAGTGYQEWLEPNALYRTTPGIRVPPGDPYMGPNLPESTDTHGFMPEDVTY